jgi:hypothetical protein
VIQVLVGSRRARYVCGGTCAPLQSCSNFALIDSLPSISFTKESGMFSTAWCESHPMPDLVCSSAAAHILLLVFRLRMDTLEVGIRSALAPRTSTESTRNRIMVNRAVSAWLVRLNSPNSAIEAPDPCPSAVVSSPPPAAAKPRPDHKTPEGIKPPFLERVIAKGKSNGRPVSVSLWRG